ncbi:PREDICTED: uncharacterized protein LOC106862680 [Sturnus vulgaris]|uniref:uncharacterized protein LOC106862680 n=1 Tax=Sturnus vulgaris TaxID=9172 RepID=UPI00071A14B6|nr:PREDICTED: uncharacterized protein LOC106862680 [Sturnus vulgaris]
MGIHTDTQRVTFVPRISTAVRGDAALPLGQSTPPQRESLRAAGPGAGAAGGHPTRRAAPSDAELPEGGLAAPGIRPGCAARGKAGRDETIRRLLAERGCVVIFVLVVLFCFAGDWDNSWSGLFIPVGNTSLYGLQDAVGSLGTKRASNVKAPFEEEIVLLEPHAWTLEGMAQWSDMKALSLQMETLLCILYLARKAARGHLK